MAKLCTFFPMLLVAALSSGPAHALRAIELVEGDALVRPRAGFGSQEPTASDFPTISLAFWRVDGGDGFPPPLLVRAAVVGDAPGRLADAGDPPVLFPVD